MKANIHPEYKEVTVVNPDGSTFVTKSTISGDKISLDISPAEHPAWRTDGSTVLNSKDGNIAKFNDKFGNMDLFAKKKAS